MHPAPLAAAAQHSRTLQPYACCKHPAPLAAAALHHPPRSPPPCTSACPPGGGAAGRWQALVPWLQGGRKKAGQAITQTRACARGAAAAAMGGGGGPLLSSRDCLWYGSASNRHSRHFHTTNNHGVTTAPPPSPARPHTPPAQLTVVLLVPLQPPAQRLQLAAAQVQAAAVHSRGRALQAAPRIDGLHERGVLVRLAGAHVLACSAPTKCWLCPVHPVPACPPARPSQPPWDAQPRPDARALAHSSPPSCARSDALAITQQPLGAPPTLRGVHQDAAPYPPAGRKTHPAWGAPRC